jgi:ribose/xylose/arabinose/galactoside ABC-type transport system permease subunit
MSNEVRSATTPGVFQNENIQMALKFLKDNGTLVALLILVIFFSFADEAFFTPRNLTNLARQTTIVGIIAVGMTMVILINGIDLSVGSIVGLSAITVTLLMQAGVNVWLAVLLTLLLPGVVIGLRAGAHAVKGRFGACHKSDVFQDWRELHSSRDFRRDHCCSLSIIFPYTV